MSEPTKYEIDHTLVLSTAHVTEATALLFDGAKGEDYWNIRWEYGWIFYAEQDLSVLDMPDEVVRVCSLARDLGCKWVRFDCDGPVIPGLPTWEGVGQ